MAIGDSQRNGKTIDQWGNEMKTLEQLMLERTALDAEIEKLKNGGKRTRREWPNTHYFAVSEDGLVDSADDVRSEIDDYRFSVGNYHEAVIEALAWRDRQIATQQIKDRIAELNAQQGWVADWGDEDQEKNRVYFDHEENRLSRGVIFLYQHIPSEFYGSKETIETVIKELEPQIKLWLGIN